MTFMGTLDRPLVIRLPWDRPIEVDGAVLDVLRGPVRRTAVALLVVMMAAGVALAVVSAIAAERDGTEGIGTFGTELGAALWFAGAVAWGSRRGATVRRGLLLSLTFVAGIGLVATALVAAWSGAALALAMEFGVGMLAVPVIDVVLIGTLHRGLDTFGSARATALTVSLMQDGRLVRISSSPP